MKKILLLLFVSLGASAQIVNIPDANFKNFLVLSGTTAGAQAKNNLGLSIAIDTNNDSEIQISEALAVWELDLTGMQGSINFTGLNAFSNLRTLIAPNLSGIATGLYLAGFQYLENLDMHGTPCGGIYVAGSPSLKHINFQQSYNGMVGLNLSNMPKLESVNAKLCQVGSVNLTGSPLIKYLNFEVSLISQLNVTGQPLLEELSCTSGGLININLLNNHALKKLNLSFNNLIGINLSGQTLLEEIIIDANNNANFTNLNVSGQANLKKLSCQTVPLTSLNISSNTQLESLTCSSNLITNLDVSNKPNLKHVVCSGAKVGVLNFTGSEAVEKIVAQYCNLTQLIIPNLTQLVEVDVKYNNLPTLDFSTCPSITQLFCIGNPISYLNLKNGSSNNIVVSNIYTSALKYICLDETEISSIGNLFVSYPNVNLNTYCSFEPGGNYNTISGVFTVDSDNNGCSTSDSGGANIKVAINDGTLAGATITNIHGNYSFYTQGGNFILTPKFENAAWFSVTPPTATVSFADSNNNTVTQNFCITSLGNHPDVEVVIVPLLGARPGFDATYKIVYKNKGNQVLSGAITFNYDDAVLDYVSATPAYTSSSTGQVSWDYINLAPFESRSIEVMLNVNGPMETPPVNIGDVLHYSVAVTPTIGDETPADNTFNFSQTVVGSYDPNDITCLEGETVHPDKIGEYLHYNINFENTGTAPATFIVVKDVIDVQKFDINSLQVLNASHNVETRVTGNKVEFIFDDINLGAQGKGNVVFKIKTKPTVAVNSTVTQKADIFFDYNWPIATNDANTTFTVLSRDSFEVDSSVKVYPNPAQNTLNIEAGTEIASIQLYDVQGRILHSGGGSGASSLLDISSKPSGVYFVKVITYKGANVAKIIKE